MNDWIYESPDRGKTVTRRKSGEYGDNNYQVQVGNARSKGWWPATNLVNLANDMVEQEQLRQSNPALKSLWEQYHTMLQLTAHGPNDDYM